MTAYLIILSSMSSHLLYIVPFYFCFNVPIGLRDSLQVSCVIHFVSRDKIRRGLIEVKDGNSSG